MNPRISKTIYISRAFAVLSIICAHCSTVGAQSSNINQAASLLLDSLGSFGVGFFLFFGGYLLFYTKRGFKEFFSRKLTTLVVPWAFCGTAVYFYIHLRKGGIGVLGLLKWLLGAGTYLYYMTVLMVLFLVCFYIRKNKIALFGLAAASVAVNLLTAFGVIVLPNNYLNPMNFMIYFAAGLLVANYGVMERLMDFAKKTWAASLAVLTAVLLILSYNGIAVGYFEAFYIPIEIIALCAALGASAALAEKNAKFFENIGKASFSIYLLHMPIAGMIARVFGKADIFLLTLARPFVVLAIVYAAVLLAVRVLPDGKIRNAVCTLTGIPREL